MCTQFSYLTVSLITAAVPAYQWATGKIFEYIAIRHPLKAKYICTLVHARVVILSVWLLSFICSIPILFGQQHIEVGYRRIGYYCLKEWSKQFYSKFYELYMLILMLVIPSVIMTVAYLGICQEMWNVTYRRADMRSGSMAENGQVETNTPSGTGFRSLRISGNTKRKKKNTTVEDDKTKMQVVKMLVVVVLLFIICWAPILINNVLVGFQHLNPLNYGYLKPMRIVFNLMAYFNSCINPIVYSFMSKNFRETFKHSFRSIFRGRFRNDRKRTGRSTVSFATRSTSLNRTHSTLFFSLSLFPSLSLSLSLSLSFSFSFPFLLYHFLSLFLALSFSLSRSLSFSLLPALSFSLLFALSFSLTISLSLSLSLFISPSLILSPYRSVSRSLILCLLLALSLSRSLSRSHSLSSSSN
ncbi:CCKAR [Acanthosepion pharaonis]|uniref:CCKAR n=1 Tax=Acanthosepion pharaonis TaxID=158019 RepID=A0A812E9P3_ACAPH|nr:CCKAR [Sepia pharaonis]